MLGERQQIVNWPRVHRLTGHRVGISAGVITPGRYILVVRSMRLLMLAVSVGGLLSATQGLWQAMIPEGTTWYGLSIELVSIRMGLASMAERFPDAAAAVWYDPRRLVDWHILGLSLLLLVSRRGLAAVGGWLLTPRTSVTCTVSPRVLKVRVGWFRRMRFRRDDPRQPVSVRAVDPELWNAKHIVGLLGDAKALGENAQPPGIIEVIAGLRRRRVLFAVRADQAEAIASRCNEALRETADLL